MKFAPLLAVGLFGLSAMSMRADGIGTQVFGTLTINGGSNTNYFDPANGIADPSAKNYTQGPTVTIGNGLEFGTTDGKTTYHFDFTGNSLTFTNTNNNSTSGGGEGAVTFTFTDSAFTGFNLTSNNAGITYTFSGNTLRIQNPGGFLAGTSTFNYTTAATPPAAATPEPNSLMLLGTGVLGFAGLVRRKLKS